MQPPTRGKYTKHEMVITIADVMVASRNEIQGINPLPKTLPSRGIKLATTSIGEKQARKPAYRRAKPMKRNGHVVLLFPFNAIRIIIVADFVPFSTKHTFLP
jgi:hypothetical protein